MSGRAEVDNDTTSEDVRLLVAILPSDVRAALRDLPLDELLEVVMDLGRPPQARFHGASAALAERPVGPEDLNHVLEQVGEFTEDIRAGIPRTLHRISALRIVRAASSASPCGSGAPCTEPSICYRTCWSPDSNILLLGRPGVGKTTKLREAARILADTVGKRVIVIDTSNEIAGEGDIPHPAIGSARRMQVPRLDRQHAVMIEAGENHMPEVIIVDEIGT